MVKDNSKWWKHLFSFSGRASRLEFNLVILCSWIPLIILGMDVFHTHKLFARNDESILYWLMAVAIFGLYFSMAAVARRNHDMGRSAFDRENLSGLEFYIRKGDHGINRFGSNPCRDYDEQLAEMEE